MNASLVLERIKLGMGLTEFKLPISDDKIIHNIRKRSLPTFSTFYPYKIYKSLNTSCTKVNNGSKMNYQFPSPSEVFIIDPKKMGKLKVHDIQDVYLQNDLYTGGFGNLGLDTYGLIEANAGINLNQLENIPITFDFRQPNILIVPRLNLLNFDNVTVVLSCDHPENMVTIPEDQEENFMDLATADTKMFLYNNMKWYNDIDTTFGSINLKIDDWSSGESDRKEWVENNRHNFLNNQEHFVWVG